MPVQAIGLDLHLHCRVVAGQARGTAARTRQGRGGRRCATRTLTEAEKALRQPQNFWINIALTLVVMGTMVALGDKLAPAIVFMVGTCLALLINYRDVDMQRQRIDAHARAALLMACILLAAGVFTGIMQNSGMLKAMAQTAVGVRPRRHGAPHADRPRHLSHAAKPAVRSRLVLLRRLAGDRRSRRPARRARRCNSPRPRCSAR